MHAGEVSGQRGLGHSLLGTGWGLVTDRRGSRRGGGSVGVGRVRVLGGVGVGAVHRGVGLVVVVRGAGGGGELGDLVDGGVRVEPGRRDGDAVVGADDAAGRERRRVGREAVERGADGVLAGEGVGVGEEERHFGERRRVFEEDAVVLLADLRQVGLPGRGAGHGRRDARDARAEGAEVPLVVVVELEVRAPQTGEVDHGPDVGTVLESGVQVRLVRGGAVDGAEAAGQGPALERGTLGLGRHVQEGHDGGVGHRAVGGDAVPVADHPERQLEAGGFGEGRVAVGLVGVEDEVRADLARRVRDQDHVPGVARVESDQVDEVEPAGGAHGEGHVLGVGVAHD